MGEGGATAFTTTLRFPEVLAISGLAIVEVAFSWKVPSSTPEELVTLTEKVPKLIFRV